MTPFNNIFGRIACFESFCLLFLLRVPYRCRCQVVAAVLCEIAAADHPLIEHEVLILLLLLLSLISVKEKKSAAEEKKG